MHFKKLRIPLLILLTVVYNFFFWEEKLGVNLLIFSVLTVSTIFLFNLDALKSKAAWITAGGTLLTGLLVLFHNSGFAKFAHIAAVFTFAGFAHQKDLRSLLASLGTLLQNYILGPVELVKSLGAARLKTPQAKKGLAYVKITLIPLVILSVFFFIFQAANPRFAALTGELGEVIANFMESLFKDFSIARFFYLLLGIFLITGLLFNADIHNLLRWDRSQPEEVQRVKKKGKRRFKMLALKREFRSGVILLAMVNLLLLIVNIIDINWIWFGFQVPEGFNLSQFVHEGTYLLILSILLSMGIMLYFFRANLNFFQQNKWLRWGSYAWIVQNAIMVISVALRNYHYIDYHGLAYKRIGVIFFLALTLFGLGSLFLKILRKKSGYFLWKTNAWAVYGVMLLIALFNWDGIIVNHNLNHNTDKSIDVPFLLTLSDKALPEMYAHREIFSEEYTYDPRIRSLTEKDELNSRIRAFHREMESHSWLSWNYADQQTYRYFNQIPEKDWLE